MYNKFITYIGISLAVSAYFYEKVSHLIFLAIFLCTIIVCWLLECLFTKMANSNYKFIDKIVFFIHKNPNNFRLKDKIITFEIKSPKEACYYVLANSVQAKKSEDGIIYHGRYCWSQEKDIKCDVRVNDKKTDNFKIGEDIKWSTITIFSNDILHKNDCTKIEYNLTELYIDNIKYHKFLSCKVIEKIDNLKLNFVVPSNFLNNNAYFIIQNSKGDTIFKEPLKPINGNIFTKTIEKPRIGRKYIIKLE